MATQVVTLADIDAAAERIKDHVRRTPCLRSRFTLNSLHRGELLLKLECLQVTGSFKARGASNAVLALDAAARARGIITASGGNHGLAVAYASHFTGVPAVVYLPEFTPAEKTERIRAWGADVVVEGGVWDDASRATLRAFQLHFRPANFDGQPDADSAARLWALLERYRPEALEQLEQGAQRKAL